jgi:hypothetical protein
MAGNKEKENLNDAEPQSTFHKNPKASSKKVALIAAAIIIILAVITSIYASQKSKNDIIKSSEGDISVISGNDLEVSWNCRVNGDYIYIEGIATNKSTKDIAYYEIGAEYYDKNGNLYDTDSAHGNGLGAGKATSFRIMHLHNPKFASEKLVIKKVD